MGFSFSRLYGDCWKCGQPVLSIHSDQLSKLLCGECTQDPQAVAAYQDSLRSSAASEDARAATTTAHATQNLRLAVPTSSSTGHGTTTADTVAHTWLRAASKTKRHYASLRRKAQRRGQRREPVGLEFFLFGFMTGAVVIALLRSVTP